MNALTIPSAFNAPSTRFAQNKDAFDDLAAGVAGGYGSISFKGKVWTINHRGTSTPLMRPDGDGPRNSIEVVFVKSPAVMSKTWYEKGYVEGSTEAPDCSSTNGVTPVVNAPKKQAVTCAACPMNAWGSQKKQDGTAGKGKACSDAKRCAVVPLGDIPNEGMGGAMLLKIPAASLQDFAAYGTKMQGLGYPACGIGTKISFDPSEAFPKLVFEPIRPLTDAEVDIVMKMRNDQLVTRILSETPGDVAPAAPTNDLPATFAKPATPAVQVAAPAPVQPVAQVTPVHTAPATVPVAQAPSVGGFGGAEAPAPKPVAVTPKVTAPEPVVAAPAAAFDAALDDQLDALLPK